MKNVKNEIIAIMNEAEKSFKTAATEAGKVYGNQDLTDEAKYHRAAAISGVLNSEVERLHDKVEQAEAAAIADLERVKKFNSDRRLTNPDYQDSVIRTADFIVHIPDTLGQTAIEKRLWPFYGDDLAREYLSSIAAGISESRKARGVEGFSINELFPDVYALQLAALERIAGGGSLIGCTSHSASSRPKRKAMLKSSEMRKQCFSWRAILRGSRNTLTASPPSFPVPLKPTKRTMRQFPVMQ